jgi:DNA-binding MarR family transcriptional regulator
MAEAARRGEDLEIAPAIGIAGALARSRLSSLLGFRLRQAETAMHRDFIRSLKQTDLTQKHLAVLLLVQENPHISQIQLCTVLGADPNTMMAFVDRLSERGLVDRVRSRADRRRMELQVSDDGRRLLDQALALVDEHESRFKARFSPQELEQLMDFLTRIAADDSRP